MLKFLADRQSGLDDPLVMRRAESTRRSYALDLSKRRDFEVVHLGGINSLDIDPVEARYLLSGSSDGSVGVHDLENFTGDVKYTSKSVCFAGRGSRHRHKHTVETVIWYPLDTGMFISSGTDKLLKVWDTNTLVPADEFEFSGIIYCHAMSSVATKHCLISVACQSSTLKLVDLKSGSATHTLKGHKTSVLCTKWSTRDEFIVASGGQDNQVLLWDIRSAKGALKSLDQYNGKTANNHYTANTAHSGHVNGMTFTSDGLHLVTFGTDDRIRLWNVASGKNTMVNYGKVNNEWKKNIDIGITQGCSPDILFVPNGTNIEMLDIFRGSQIDILRGHYMRVNCCIIHPHYQELYSGGSDRNILVWTPDTETAYEDHIKEKHDAEKEQVARIAGVVARSISATADTWSSDEDS
ncbi:DNA excision repair protein ERCC-8-like [Pecten maximus]|uniref:DNA excision repair protein ERCC-8-like n=1 Tax=Pecten maximus TaxID=6579 RepID=UPI0014587743|nr:DNA excision repair protein ERCC-8-like [Pecten maximus]